MRQAAQSAAPPCPPQLQERSSRARRAQDLSGRAFSFDPPMSPVHQFVAHREHVGRAIFASLEKDRIRSTGPGDTGLGESVFGLEFYSALGTAAIMRSCVSSSR